MGYFCCGYDANEIALRETGPWSGDWISALNDQFDIELESPEQLEEIEIMTRLMVAASQSDSPLARADIDRILGLDGD